MRQVAQNYKTGELSLLEVPVPATKPGGVLVRTEYSLISAGTEMMKVEESKLSMVGMAKARPDQVKKVVESAFQQGLAQTYRKVMNRLDAYTPLGYSLAGVVVEVGEGVDEFKVGQRVACAGNQYAFHAELNWVPKNLVVPVPDGVSAKDAAYATVGAIAMQGFRQAAPGLGETAVVIGLGLVGQLLVQILASAGVKCIGSDISENRCNLAVELGAEAAGASGTPGFEMAVEKLMALSDGYGADYVFITASTSSRQPVEFAAEIARDRAMIVDIGKTNLDLPWNAYYEKELDVRFSRSYGPGRYDPMYEERGVDYPIGYVRWTEGRNMSSVLDLIARGSMNVSRLTDHIVPIDDAVGAYERLHAGEMAGIGVLFEYPEQTSMARTVTSASTVRSSGAQGLVRLGVIGAGNYATTMLLPHLAEDDRVEMITVATTTALSAATAQRRFGFDEATTDIQTILDNDHINTVLIATRHDTHAEFVVRALEAGKAVFVEKPLAISADQLDRILETISTTGNDRLMVGFNRRFAPLLQSFATPWRDRGTPLIAQYDVNAGRLDADSWYRQTDLHGGRFAGEGGHFIDTLSWMVGALPTAVTAMATENDPDNLSSVIRFENGSVATLNYLTQGDSRYPKEMIRVFGDGSVSVFHNFARLESWGTGRKKHKVAVKGVDKGQRAELGAFVDAVTTGAAMPISLESLVRTTRATLAVSESITSGATVVLS